MKTIVMDLFFLGGGMGWRKVNKVHYSLCENCELSS